VIAFVNPVEDPRVRVLTNLVDVDAERIHAGMPVRVTFTVASDDVDDDVYLPMFTAEP